jgi:hypothetical protein
MIERNQDFWMGQKGVATKQTVSAKSQFIRESRKRDGRFRKQSFLPKVLTARPWWGALKFRGI